ncbi:uncharacterized protein EV420DRAFT_1575367 [Desarmillaria tabescens]|uniref:Uncharacterized protein n=1 Tax=Armillaria tabescens TaxID=1929756 RepID=A0AA39MS16_ARMTA|nr:uncharacterized protein EV420DRAFT_1575367 [Desarmillaria tabescens]KAK0443914.1 hypothetical protein EV420DRAFT_1575367 [Desarmillaria tabescens]
MPEYVYALHDFIPENEDEVPFRTGERIEVIEKDDAYGDGWWTGLNISGKKGLFPQSYTSPTEPAVAVGIASSSTPPADPDTTLKTPLQPLHEEPEIESPQPPPAIFLNGQETDGANGDGEVMKATMTDVQKAIEQLGRGNGITDDADGARSFSFASSRGGRDTEEDTDFDMSDADAAGDEGEGWHKGARRKLAEKARQAVEDAERLEMIGMSRSSSNRTYAPPIAVELSDESEDEEDDQHYTQAPGFQSQRRHSYIPEEDEDVESVPGHSLLPSDEKTLGDRVSRSPRSSTHFSPSERDDTDTQPATATRTNFAAQPERVTTPPLSENQPTPPKSVTLAQAAAIPMPQSPPETDRTNTPIIDAVASLPSPVPAAISPTTQSKHSSVTSSPASPSHSAPGNDSLLSATVSTIPTSVDKKEKTHPSEWTLEEVVDWLKSKGFDQDVCEKFTEQEITGDVLLELDVNLLKTEIGIMAFGKRMRIANAITDLRRPPSIVYSDHPEQPSPPSPMIVSPHLFTTSPATYAEGPSHTHSRNQSQSQSHHSYPGSTRYSHSVQSSVNGFAALISPESAPHTADTPVSPRSTLDPEPEPTGLAMPATNGKAPKSRPSQLSLSPSDGALNASVKAVGDIPEEAEEEREERAAQSEGEALPARSVRRRLFGRSHDSENSGKDSGSRASKDGISPSSSILPLLTDKDKDRAKDKAKDKYKDKDLTRHGRKQRSVDVGKSGERLSLFAGSFGSTLGKSRKPPPKYSGDDTSEKGSSFHLPRLYSTSGRKTSSSGRPSTPGTPKRGSKEEKDGLRDGTAQRKDSKEAKEGRTEHATLRKRTSSYPGSQPVSPELPKSESNVGQLKPGQSILEQIGEPDHTGWMRKRGDRYNSWKLRYFVLKGPHLYCLRSDSPSETKIKGYINIIGYRVTVDENVNPGKYGFRIEHEHDKMHFFSSDEKVIIRDWMKAIMKATIARDYTQPVISSCNIPTIPLMVAQAMNPAPRPPSPTARDATQKALRRDNPNQLSSRDARVLMGLPSSDNAREERTRLESFFSDQSVDLSVDTIDATTKAAPPRPSRRKNSTLSVMTPMDNDLIEWANSHLPSTLQISDTTVSIYGGLHLFRIAESIKGRSVSPPVPDSAFPVDSNDEKLDGLFRLFDFLLDHDVKMGSVSINDVRQGKPEKIVQLLRALRAWEDKRKALAQSIRGSVSSGSVSATGFMASSPWTAI